jgi:dipeptidyl aminopeptidase/acylaminoacyl peptidase
VFLPLEPHAYGALETKQHVLWEIDRWMDKYVKPETPVVAAGTK